MNPAEPTVLRAESVTKTFTSRKRFLFDGKHNVATRDFDISVARGVIVGLMGPSGAGKTTLGRILAGLLRPDSGEVFLNDVPLYGNNSSVHHKTARKYVRYIFQNVNAPLNPRMMIADILEEPLTVHTDLTRVERVRRMEDVAREVDLPLSLFDKYPWALSGGEKRRAGIARALMCRPLFIIADEPTAGLDEELRAGLLELLSRLRDIEGIGIMVISHDKQAIAAISDEVVVMDNGRRV